ncbi:L-type lectin-domain containing protein, partial [Kordia periserrulae]|uniref:L-type lectin-domain containing protein n=1 Tax=Kordia periserrulae TaxID=701523 RepID=UPI001FEC523D
MNPSLIGDTTDIGGDCFEITQNVNNQSGAVWSGTAIDMQEDFVVEFRGFFGTNDANGADGITFIIKNTQTPEIGNLGGGMGYEGINNSIAVEFDTWQNNDLSDPFFDHLAIVSQGNNNHSGAANLAGPVQASPTSSNIEDGVEHIIRIEWTAATTTLDVYFDCSLRLSYTGDVVNNNLAGVTQAYFGFTGSTGGAANLQRVCFDYVSFANSLAFTDELICEGESISSVDATVTGATSYAWTPTTGVSNPNIPNPIFTPTTTTTYTVDISNSCADTIQESFTITVEPIPTANPVADIAVCDDASNDGVEEFSFTTLNATILGMQNTSDFTVSYHLSQDDANNNANALTFPYTNTNQCEQIFARVANNLIPTCYATTDFEICVNSQPMANQPNDMNTCDPEADNMEVFDLSTQEATILGSQNAADVTITFHASNIDANSGANPLPTNYTGSNNETIHVRVESTEAGSNCYAITSFQLFLDTTPIANSVADIIVCDDATNDDVESFDFSTLNATVLGTQDASSFTVSYHPNQVDADNNTNALTFPYTNTAQSEEIFIRIQNNSNTDCYNTASFEIFVNTQPIANQPENMVACDLDGNGMEDFDLSTQEAEILGTQNAADFNITFHSDPLDAQNDVNPLPPVYSGANNETIYVRIESTEPNNDCFAITDFLILFETLPTANTPTDLIVCDDETPDGFTAVDLNVKNDEISGGISGLSVRYYLTQTDADNDVNALAIPYTNTSNPQTVYVRVETANSGCYVTTTLTIMVEDAPQVFPATPLEFCDTDNDGFGVFDIRSTESQITGGITNNIAVTYHETPEDADNNVNALADTYSNINPYNQTLYVRVENVLTGCYNVVSLALIVYDSPEIAALDTLTLAECDDITGDQIAQFDLTQAQTDILNGEDPITHTIRYYNTQANAIAGMSAGEINNPNAYSNIPPSPQIIWVRVEDQVTGCFTIT